jgi:hypothetical protein
MSKEVARIQADYDDSMTVHNLIEELNDVLFAYNLSVEVEDEEHDGYDVIIVKKLDDNDF